MSTTTTSTPALPVLGPWEREAACLGVDPDLFFPERNASPADAKEVCARCRVREACLEYALAQSIQHGVWGGLSAPERRRLRAARRRRLTLVPVA